MDSATTDFYRHYVNDGAIQSEARQSAISRFFERAFKQGGKVLDAGSGSGRDLAELRKQGFDAYGIEPNDAMRTYAEQKHPDLKTRMQPGALPLTGKPFGGEFDGVLCNAVLMHIPADQLQSTWQSLRRVLKPGGRVLFSLPSMRPDLLENGHDRDGRFFQNHDPLSIASILEALGFARITLGSDATSVYPDISWTIFLFELNETRHR